MSLALRSRRTWGQRVVLFVNVCLIGLALLTAGLLQQTWNRAASVNRVQLGSALTPADPDTPGRRVMNVLLVGSDSSAGLDPDNPINDGRVGERNGDVVIVAHLDERDGSAALLSFPRDLWVTIAGTDREAKLNAAFAIGGPAATGSSDIDSESKRHTKTAEAFEAKVKPSQRPSVKP